MRVIRGHFDGRHVVLDEPAPSELLPQTPVRVVIEDPKKTVLDKLIELAEDDDLPADYSEQHEHYAKGLPRR